MLSPPLGRRNEPEALKYLGQVGTDAMAGGHSTSMRRPLVTGMSMLVFTCSAYGIRVPKP